jgi:DMSO reductase family type II enzyme heme b subunit
MNRNRLSTLVIALLVSACGQGAPTAPATDVRVVERATVPAAPDDAAWSGVPRFDAALILQDMVEPRLLEPSTAAVAVQAVTDGTRLAFRLVWDDPTQDDQQAPAKFPDGCAVQLPEKTEPDVPAPQMGEPGRAVEIVFWRASWQAAVDGRPDTIQALYPNAAVDHYPFEAPSLEPGSDAQRAMAARYAPARALGNAMSGPRERPVEDLIAEGPGTLRPGTARSTGHGIRTAAGWQVVISRPLPAGLVPGGRTQVAFAVWQGAHGEAGARKMRSVWVPMTLEEGPS